MYMHECHLCTLPRSYCNWHKESSLVIQKPTGYPIHIKSVTDRNLYFRYQREKRNRFERHRGAGGDIVHRLHSRWHLHRVGQSGKFVLKFRCWSQSFGTPGLVSILWSDNTLLASFSLPVRSFLLCGLSFNDRSHVCYTHSGSLCLHLLVTSFDSLRNALKDGSRSLAYLEWKLFVFTRAT
jgi:hypothetical protein